MAFIRYKIIYVQRTRCHDDDDNGDAIVQRKHKIAGWARYPNRQNQHNKYQR